MDTKERGHGITTKGRLFRRFALAFLFLLLLCIAGMGGAAAQQTVSTPAELDDIRNNLGGDYELTSDIDLSGYGDWEPIGDPSNPFTGTIDGQGHEISGLTVNRSSPGSGLIGYAEEDDFGDTVIENLGVVGADVQGEAPTGILIGAVNDTDGSGVVGYGVAISNSYVEGTVTGDVRGSSDNYDRGVGGMVGAGGVSVTTLEINNSYADVNVDAVIDGLGDRADVGGLVGILSTDNIIKNSWSEGEVRAEADSGTDAFVNVGGLVGEDSFFDSNTVRNSFSVADVVAQGDGSGTSFSTAGGLVGYTAGNVETSFSAGDVSATDVGNVGGFVGENESSSSGMISGSYWDTSASGQSDGVGAGSSGDLSGLSTADMQDVSASSNMGAFAFYDEWREIQNEYPVPATHYSAELVGTNEPVGPDEEVQADVLFEYSGPNPTGTVDAELDIDGMQPVTSGSYSLSTGGSQTVTLTNDQGGFEDNDSLEVLVQQPSEAVVLNDTLDVELSADRVTNGVANPTNIDPRETSTVTAEVVDDTGNPVQGVDVTFNDGANGSFNIINGTSNSSGTVAAEYTANITDSDSSVTVTIDTVSVNATSETVGVNVNNATLTFDTVGTVEPTDGTTENEVGLQAVLKGDAAIENEDVTFSVQQGNGSLGTTGDTTNATGWANTTYTVGQYDWQSGVEVEAEVNGTSIQDTVIFDVNEPDPEMNVTSDENEVPPKGDNHVNVTATVKSEQPFNEPQEGENVTFDTTGSGVFDAGTPPLGVDTDSAGNATVTYQPVEADYGSTVSVSGNLNGLIRSTTFDVQETVEINASADLEVAAPSSGVDITFELRDSGGVVDTETTNVSGTDTATVGFGQQNPLSASEEYTVEVTGADGVYQTGVTGTAPGNEGSQETVNLTLGANEPDIDVAADFGVTVPEDGFDAVVKIESVGPGGSVVSELVNGTVTLDKGDSSLADSTDTTTYTPAPIDSDHNYSVAVTADGYENASATEYVAPGDTSNIDVGTLVAENVNVSATANLNQPAPSNAEFEFTLEGPGGMIQNVTDTDAGATASADFSPAGAIDADRNYTVTVTSELYEDDVGETYVAPGGSENQTFTLDYVGLNEVAQCRTINASNAPTDAVVSLTSDITGSSASSCIDIETDDVTFDAGGNLIGSDDGGVAVDVEDPSSPDGPRNVTVENVTVKGWEHGVLYEDADDGTVWGVEVDSNDRGIVINGTSEGNLVTSTAVNNSIRTGIRLQASGNTVNDTVLGSNGVTGGYPGLRVLSGNNLFENVTLSGSGRHGVHVDSPDNTLRDVSVTGSARSGVYVSSGGRNTTFADLTVLDTMSDGVFLEPGANRTEVTNATVTGIGTGATPANAFVVGSSNNRLTSLTVRADNNFSMVVGGTGNVLRDVNASDGPDSGAYIAGANTTVTSSVFNDNNLAGVLVTPGGDGTVFEDVTASDNGNGNRGTGFAVASSLSLLTNVTANGNAQYGVAVNRGSVGNRINDSEALRNGLGGIEVAGSRTEVVAVNASDNTESGVNVSSSGNVIDDVTANGNGDGVVVTGDNNTVTELTANENDDDGLDVDISSGHTVENATVVENGDDGVEFGATAGRFTRIDASGNGGNGVLATDSVNITDSRFEDNTNGVRAEADVRIVNTTATSSDGSAVFVDGGSAEVTNVTVRNPGDWALRAVNGGTATAEGFGIGRSVVPNTTVGFDARDAALVNQTSPPTDAFNERNVSRFVEATGTASDGYLNITFGYNDTDVSDISETALDVWRNNGTWGELGGTVDTGANEVSYNVSDDELGSTYAPLANLSAVDSCRTVDATNEPENDFAFLTRNVSGPSDCLNLTVSGLTFDGDGHTVEGTGSAVGINVSNASSPAGEPSDVTVRNVTVTGWENGVRVGDAHDATVTSVVASGNAGIAVVTDGENTTVSDTVVEESGQQSLRLDDGADGSVVRNTSLLGNTDGSSLDLFSDGNVVENVTTVSEGDNGVYVSGVNNVIRSVNAVGSLRNGISVTSNADNTTVLDTLVADNDGQGIRVEGDSFTVSRTLVAQNDEQGIRLQGDSAKVEDTELLANGRSTDVSGIDMLGNDGVLADVNVSGSGDNGVYVTGDDAVVRNATLTANNGTGIQVTSSSTNTTVVESTATDNDEGGLFIEDTEAKANALDVGSAVVDARASNVVLREVVSAPDAPLGQEYLGEYINATNLGPDASLNVTFSYEEDDLTGIGGESTLSVWRHDGSWNEVGGTVYEGQGEIAANVTDFSLFAPTGRVDTGGGGYNEPPRAEYEVEGSLVAGNELTLDASGSDDPDGGIDGYTWSIDGTSDENGEEVSHTFDEPGLYEVELTVEDDGGKQDTQEDVLRIDEGNVTEETEEEDTANETDGEDETEENVKDEQETDEQDTRDTQDEQVTDGDESWDEAGEEGTVDDSEDGTDTGTGTDDPSENQTDGSDEQDGSGATATAGGDLGGPVSPAVLLLIALLVTVGAVFGIWWRRKE